MVEAKKPPKKVIKTAKAELKKAEEQAVKETLKDVKQLVETEQIAETIVKAEKELAKKAKIGKIAKAGKRSTKAIKEAEAKVAKEERKAHLKETEATEKKAKPVIKTRTRLERQGKKLQDASKLIDKNKEYSLKEACELVVKTSPVKFDATVELHVRLGVDPKLSDQNIRASLVLPNGTGKTARVAVIAEADKLETAKKAGADIALGDELLQQLEKSQINFDVLIATPTQMPKLGKYAKLLGPKGLMPNPKSGTVTINVAKAVKEAKAGKVEYRIDANSIIHLGIGKISFGGAKLLANAEAILDNIKAAKPASLKSTYILSIFMASSMGPSIKISVA